MGESKWKMIHGNCLDVLREMPDNSIDGIVTDPPYGLGTPPDALEMLRDWMDEGHHDVKTKKGFMGKDWDAFVPQPVIWKECLRVLKPGGHLAAFAGCRTQDLMGLALRLAGFEIRDCLMWIFGSGFPKSHDIAKSIDNKLGLECIILKPASDCAKKFDGYGSALKPAYEPILLCRKPIDGTLAHNALAWGVGGLNIDACRVPGMPDVPGSSNISTDDSAIYEKGLNATASRRCAVYRENPPSGRWPANVMHDGSDEVVEMFPITKSGKMQAGAQRKKSLGMGGYHGNFPDIATNDGTYGDCGSAARFFYTSKASRKDREEGLDNFIDKPSYMVENGSKHASKNGKVIDRNTVNKNNHPTVKPTSLMEWLVTLIVPAGGLVLDPFAGSGSTGKACMYTGHHFVGIEQEAEYVTLANARIKWAEDDAKKVILDQLQLF